MKILIQNSKDERVIGLGQSIKEHQVNTFDPKIPVYHLIENFSPDIIIFEENNDLKDSDIEYARQDYPNIKFVLIRDEPHETIRNIKEELFDFIFHKSSDLPDEIEHVSNIKRRKLKHLINEELVCGGEYKQEYETDFLLFTDYLDCPQGMEREYKRFLDHLNWLGDMHRLKIYGPIKIDSPYYLGNANKDDYKNIIASSKCILMYTNIWVESAYINGKLPLIFTNNFIDEVKEVYDCDFTIQEDWRPMPPKKYKKYSELAQEFLGVLYE